MKKILPAITFVARHLLAIPFAIIAGCILWTIAYLLLLIIAVIFDKGVGGPLAYPAGIIAILGASIIIGWGIFTPASAIGALVCKIFRWPRLAAIPVVFTSAISISYMMCWAYTVVMTTQSVPSTWVVAKNFTIFLAVPLGVYWWIIEGSGAVFDIVRRRIRHFRNLKQPSEQCADGDAEEAV